MKFLRFLLPLVILLIALPNADAQRGGRSSGKSRSSARSAKSATEFSQKLWYGAGGTVGFQGTNNFSQAAVGLIPQVGYKFNGWLSAGPRAGLTWNYLKGNTTDGSRQRSNTWSYTAGLFARARVFDFYAQTEASFLSDGFTFIQPGFGFGPDLIALDPNTGKPLTGRQNDTQFLVGLGYNAGIGQGLSSDFGIFYNILDNVESTRSPFQIRIMFTFNY